MFSSFDVQAMFFATLGNALMAAISAFRLACV
jgi:hypothetical protein